MHKTPSKTKHICLIFNLIYRMGVTKFDKYGVWKYV